MKRYCLLVVLLMQIFTGTVVLAMEEENSPLFRPTQHNHHPSYLENWEAGKIQGYPGELSNHCSITSTLSDFSDTEKSYYMSPSCVEEACAGGRNIFFKNHKPFEFTNMSQSCSLLVNYQPSETLLPCLPLSKINPKLQGKGWFCVDLINDGQNLNTNNIPIYFEIRKVENSTTKSRPREEENVFFQEMQQGENKKFRKESNEMNVI